MTKKQKTWLILGIIGAVLIVGICIASVIYSLSHWGVRDGSRELYQRAEAYISQELNTKKADSKSASLNKDGKEYYCRAEVTVYVGFADTYIVYFEKKSEDGEWILLRYEKKE